MSLKDDILLKFDERLYPNEIARALSCTRAYVYAVLNQCRKDFKLELAKRRLADAKEKNNA
jgi:hypothetical protein